MADDFKQHMGDKLRIEELDRAIQQMTNGKSPGLDGLTVEFYTFFLERYQSGALECLLRMYLSRKSFPHYEARSYNLNPNTLQR